MLEELEETLKTHPGCIVEIGAGFGDNTIEFLKLAKKYDREVVVIDPFEEGWGEMPSSYQYAYGIFNDKTQGYKDLLHLHKKNSLCQTSEELCNSLDIAFAFVDGLQYKGAVLSDLRIVSHAKLICVDDMDRESAQSQVPSAVKCFVAENNKQLTIKGRWALIK